MARSVSHLLTTGSLTRRVADCVSFLADDPPAAPSPASSKACLTRCASSRAEADAANKPLVVFSSAPASWRGGGDVPHRLAAGENAAYLAAFERAGAVVVQILRRRNHVLLASATAQGARRPWSPFRRRSHHVGRQG